MSARILLIGLSLGLLAVPARAEDPAKYTETLEVVRYVIDVRVTDSHGRAVQNLEPGQFTVSIGDRPLVVEAATWIGEAASGRNDVSSEDESNVTPSEGRDLVFYIQTDFARNRERIVGQFAFINLFADRILEALHPNDRVAVLSFDSHLHLLADFTTNRRAIREALDQSLATGSPAAPAVAATRGLLESRLDESRMRTASRAEEGLLVTAQALRGMPKRTVMILAGWGFGDLTMSQGGSVASMSLPSEWTEAVEILRQEHIPVMSVGTGQGQLSYGIATTARLTGGVSASAVGFFPTQSLAQLEGALSGRYEVMLRSPEPIEPGEHHLSVAVNQPHLHVFAPRTIIVNETDALYEEAISLINAGQVELGVTVLRDAIRDGDWPTELLKDRIAVMIDAAQWEAAVAIADELANRGALDEESKRQRDEATKKLERRNASGAVSFYSEALRSLRDGDAQSARRTLTRALEANPRLAVAWYERGMLSLAEGKRDDAAADLSRYIELEPSGEHAADVRAILSSLESPD